MARNGTIDPLIRVYRPDGTLKCSWTSATSPFANTCVLDATGTHLILAGDDGWDEGGTYELRLTGP